MKNLNTKVVNDFISMANKVLNWEWSHDETDLFVRVGWFTCSITVDGCVFYTITYTDWDNMTWLFEEIPSASEEKIAREKMYEFLRTKLSLLKLQAEVNAWA